ncbi:MAG TPA: WecB/TagA/CpsF family glycosyltransferase [Opitutaceae bacterium]|jgi:N-acetylglucosaminyldiphosphoundecaprenol N-acetyl-beta-D-mannosaminyltransferase|nr:WecB/TagA/CpsF family glycosyltransferase [Opitutaceae bacterium]
MNPGPVPRYNVQGVGISELTLAKATDLVVGAKGSNKLGYVCVCTVHSIGEARSDPALRAVLNDSWLSTPDGMPLVWMGPPGVGRVYGPDLMLSVCDKGRSSGLRHFFFGGTEGVAQELAARLGARFPGLAIAGTRTPPFRDLTADELSVLSLEIAQAGTDIVWVGLGMPKQERFMAGPGRSIAVPLMIGVGAAFDFHTGRVRQAPLWMQRAGLEWLFRLCMEPRRLFWRYATTNTAFVARLVAQKLGLGRYPLA